MPGRAHPVVVPSKSIGSYSGMARPDAEGPAHQIGLWGWRLWVVEEGVKRP